MSSMKSQLAMMIALSGMMGGFGKPTSRFEDEDFLPKEVKKVIPKGCKEFTFNGITVVALTEDRARKKIHKIISKQDER